MIKLYEKLFGCWHKWTEWSDKHEDIVHVIGFNRCYTEYRWFRSRNCTKCLKQEKELINV